MRFAVKLAYDGSRFHGSQVQEGSDMRTVQGDLEKALRRIGALGDEGKVKFSSRTDAGVSALGNVFSVDSDFDEGELLKALNANLDGIWCWGLGRMRDNQNPRWANSRWYRYHLPPDPMSPEEVERLRGALGIFLGTHDFRHFCRLEDERNTEVQVTRSEAFDVSGSGEMVVADVVGSRFLWHQVRRMVGAALMIADGTMRPGQLADLLQAEELNKEQKALRDSIPTMPATGLLLMDVDFKDVEFVPDRGALELALRNTRDGVWRSTIDIVIRSALLSLKGTFSKE